MIGIVGGTGPEGLGLAVRWTQAGETVAIGSRSAERGREGADRIREIVPAAQVSGGSNADVGPADVVVIALPYSGVSSTLPDLARVLAGKIVVSVVASLEWVEGRPRPVVVPAGSVAEEIAALLPDAHVTSGFHTLSAEKLSDLSADLDEDTIICGDDADARHQVMDLARRISGLRAISGGRLASSCYPEQFVGMMATLNRIHKARSGLKIVGV